MAKWRPKGWEEIEQAYMESPDAHCQCSRDFNAGASAMLEALRARGLHCDFKEWAFGEVPYIAKDFGMGTQVFIPDDPPEGGEQSGG